MQFASIPRNGNSVPVWCEHTIASNMVLPPSLGCRFFRVHLGDCLDDKRSAYSVLFVSNWFDAPTLVYALYQQRKWLAILLISLLAIEFAVAIIGVGVTLSKHNFVPLDIVSHLPNSFEYFGYVSVNMSIGIAKKTCWRISGLLVQCFVLGLTLSKYMCDSMKAIPIARLMARDGTLTFLFVTSESEHWFIL